VDFFFFFKRFIMSNLPSGADHLMISVDQFAFSSTKYLVKEVFIYA
jgi:hypothetical protein